MNISWHLMKSIRLQRAEYISFHERKTADWIKKRLEELGFTITEDYAGSYYGGDTGNIFATLKGNLEGSPILFSAHMDVVQPGCKKVPVREGNVIHAKEDTILGADDICGILEILYGVQKVIECGKPHRDLELLFTIGEELYTKGASVFDYTPVRSKCAYVPDLSGAVGFAAKKAPSIISVRAEVTGKAAHAGFDPEHGIHAIQAAAKAISRLDMGHVDEDTTFNIGTISGGTATNIVPDRCIATGEIRSYSHQKALAYVKKAEEIFTEEAEKIGADAEVTHEIHLTAYETSEESEAVRRFGAACKKIGLPGVVTETFGGSDNNCFAQHGIEGLVLSCGMYQAHSVKEYTTTEDLYHGAALIAAIILEEA